MSVVLLTPILLLGVLGLAVFLALVLVRAFSNPEARRIAKIFLLLPLTVLGLALLAFVVFVTVWVSKTRLTVPDGATVVVESDGRVRVGDLAVEVNASGKSAREASPAVSRVENAGRRDSNLDRMCRAMRSALVTTVRSSIEKNSAKNIENKSSSGGGNAKGTAVAARPESPPKQPLPGAAASAAVSPASAEPAAKTSAPPSSAAPPAATKRPDWVDAPPQPSSESYEVAVNSGPWKTRLECEQALNEEIGLAVDNYVAWQLGEEARPHVRLPEDAVRHQLVAEEWLEKVDTKFGEQMFNLHALLRFDSQIDSKLREAWNQLLVMGRIVASGAVFGGALLLLAVIYAYLRISRGSPRPLRERG